MKILILCGSPYLCANRFYDVLIESGFYMTPKETNNKLIDWYNRVFKNSESDVDGLTTSKQVIITNFWKDMLSQILSSFTADQWCFYDYRSTWLLNFWRDYDSNIFFLFLFNTIEKALANYILDSKMTEENIEHIIKTWSRYNDEILKFYNRNVGRCFLVHEEATLHSYEAFIHKLSNKFGFRLSIPEKLEINIKNPFVEIGGLLSQSLISKTKEIKTLYQELLSTADMTYEETDNKTYVVNQFLELIQTVNNAKNESLKKDLDIKRIETELTELGEKNKEIKEENDVLILQLHKIQVELEERYLEYQKLVNSFFSDFPPSEIVFDMRGTISGDNWYHAEVDGRWAGPNIISIINLPNIGEEQYKIEFNIVDAMDKEIIYNMQVFVNENPLDLIIEGDSYPFVVSSIINGGELKNTRIWQIKFIFPKTISPSEHGSDDKRKLAIRLQSIKLKTIREIPEEI